MPRSPHDAARTKQSRRFRAPRDTRLKGAKGVGELIRHRDITKAVDRLKDRLDEEHFLFCRPMDVWREALGVHGVVFEGDYYGAGNSPKPSRSQATMLSMRLNEAKRLLRHDDHHVSEPEALVVALRVLDMAGGNVKNAMAFMDAVVRLTAVAGGPARAKMAIETAAAVKRALPARG